VGNAGFAGWKIVVAVAMLLGVPVTIWVLVTLLFRQGAPQRRAVHPVRCHSGRIGRRFVAGGGAVYETDYILRIIQQMGAILRRMMEQVRDEEPGEVYESSREALQLLLGLPPTLADSLTADGLVALLSPGGMFDPERGRLAAEVFVRRVQAGLLAGLPESAAADRVKAQRLIGLTLEHGGEEDVAEARALAVELGAL